MRKLLGRALRFFRTGRMLGAGYTPTPAEWQITTGDRHANVDSFPAFTGAWSIAPADRQVNIISYPEAR